jgi:hypothetical protein
MKRQVSLMRENQHTTVLKKEAPDKLTILSLQGFRLFILLTIPYPGPKVEELHY